MAVQACYPPIYPQWHKLDLPWFLAPSITTLTFHDAPRLRLLTAYANLTIDFFKIPFFGDLDFAFYGLYADFFKIPSFGDFDFAFYGLYAALPSLALSSIDMITILG